LSDFAHYHCGEMKHNASVKNKEGINVVTTHSGTKRNTQG